MMGMISTQQSYVENTNHKWFNACRENNHHKSHIGNIHDEICLPAYQNAGRWIHMSLSHIVQESCLQLSWNQVLAMNINKKF